MRIPPAFWVAPLSALALVASATNDNIPSNQSRIVATFRQESVSVAAPFQQFSGSVLYDAAHPADASAVINVDMNSLDIGEPAYNAEVRKPEWFDSAKFPQATFHSSSVKSGAPGHLEASGALSIKGKSEPLTLQIAATRTPAGTFSFEGSFDISRKAFGIGNPSWDDVLEDRVRVRFYLVSPGH
jgi:polyisoprenoid-binding protein YceI